MKKRLTAVLLIAVLILIFGCGSAFASIPDAPDPFYAADFANVLNTDTEDYIIEQNGILENFCGAQIVVVTTDFLDGMNIEDYAYKLFNDWGIGDEDENNGVLLLLAIGEENYWCMQGKGLERVLTSGDIDDILYDNLEEDFAAEDYNAGVLKTFDVLYDTVYEYYGGTVSNDYDDADFSFDGGKIFGILVKILIAVIVIVVILIIISSFSGGPGRGYGSGGTRRKRRPSGGGGTVFIPPSTGRRKSTSSGSRPSAARRSSSGSRPSAPRRSSSSSRSSFGGGSRPSTGSGHGGGGRSRGGGAGRRGR